MKDGSFSTYTADLKNEAQPLLKQSPEAEVLSFDDPEFAAFQIAEQVKSDVFYALDKYGEEGVQEDPTRLLESYFHPYN